MILRALSALWTSFAPQMANHLWQSTLFVVLAAILTVALRKNQTRVRHWVWLTASLKFLIPFSLLIAVGSHLARPQVSTPAQILVYSTVENLSQPFAGQELPLSYQAAPSRARVSPLHLLPAIVVAVWLAGIVIVVAMWVTSWIRILFTVRKAVSVGEGPEVDALLRMESSLGVGKPIKLVLSRNWMEPGIFGIFRPVLIWPVGISRHLDDRHIEAILAHEVCHERRHDNFTAVLHMLVEAIFWFHPLVWWMGAKLEQERERACDEEVSLLCRQPKVYAESILRVCKFCSESPLACVSGITGADLKKRIVQIMTERVVHKLDPQRKLLLLAVGLAMVAVPIGLGQVKAAQARSETELVPIIPQWQTAAGGRMEFEVASVRLNKGPMTAANFRLSPDDAYTNTGGLLIADFPLETYITFAYKILPTREVFQSLFGKLPQWVQMDNYEIQARAPIGNPTKDQMRLMMQSLLKERFGVVVHYDTKDTPVLLLTLAKPGTLGPKLLRHEDGPSCDVTGLAIAGPEPKNTDIFPKQCGGIEAVPGADQAIVMGGRNTTLPMMAKSFASISRLGRPMVDGTGLSGNYDFMLKWTPDPGTFGRPSQSDSSDKREPDPQGATFVEALREQLGLKLTAGKAPLKTLVIDHIERPSEN